MTSVSKFAMKLRRNLIANYERFSWSVEKSCKFSFSVDHYRSPVFIELAEQVDSLESGLVVTANSRIAGILGSASNSKISSSIVERLTTFYVFALPWIAGFEVKDYSMHEWPMRSLRVEAFSARLPECVPTPLHQPLVIGGINDGVLALCERNDFDRLVERLDNIVTLHGAFHKEPSFLVRLSAALLHLIPNKSLSIKDGGVYPCRFFK